MVIAGVAVALVQQMYDTISYYRRQSHNLPKPKVMILEGLSKQLIAYDDTKLAGDICTKLGAYVPSSPLGTISIETILLENPDVIFIVKSGGDPEEAAANFRNTPALRSLKAIQNKRVYGIPFKLRGGCGQKPGLPRASKGAESLYILKTKSILHYRFITNVVL